MKQIHISVLGTKIAADAIEYRKRDFALDARIVEKSPFAFTCDDRIELLCQDMPFLEVSLGNEYKNQIFQLDFCKKVYDYIKDFNSDIIVLDIMCMRNFIYEMEFENGTVYRLTWDPDIGKQLPVIKEHLENFFSSKIIKETKINPLSWSNEKLKYEIRIYCEKIKKEFKGTKVVLLEGQNIYQYFDKFGYFSVLPQIDMVNQYNRFYDLCIEYLQTYYKCITILKLKNVYGNEKVKVANIFHYNLCYYNYINECFASIYKNEYTLQNANEILFRYNNKNEMELKELMLKSIVDLTYRKYKNRKIIVVGEIEVYSSLLKKKYGLEVFKSIPFDANTSINFVKEQLASFAWKNDKYMIVVTRLNAKTHLLKSLWEMGYGANVGYYCINHPLIELKNFRGHYEDFYGNILDVKTAVTIKLAGCGSKVSVGTGKIVPTSFFFFMHENILIMEDGIQTKDKPISFRLYDGFSAHIKKNVFWGNCVHCRGSFFHSMEIGSNCVLEDDVVLFNGDGHAIFDLNTNQNVNYNLNNAKPEKHKIVLGDNVRLGKQVFVLSGSQIPSGCLVEAESFVNKIIDGENSYLAGSPVVKVEE